MIKTLSEVKLFYPLPESFTLSESFLRDVQAAANKHIIPYLSQSEYDILLARYEAETLGPEQTLVWQYAQEVAVCLGLKAHLPKLAVRISDIGIHRQESDNHTAAFKYQEEMAADALSNQGWEAVEALLAYLELHPDIFTSWAASSAATFFKGMFVKNLSEFQKYVFLNDSRVFFGRFREIFPEQEAAVIKPILGLTLYAAVKANPENFTDLLAKIKPLICYAVTAEALALLPVTVNERGIFSYAYSSPAMTKGAENSNMTDYYIEQYRTKERRAAAELTAFLNANSADYPDFVAESRYYVNLNTFVPASPAGPTFFF